MPVFEAERPICELRLRENRGGGKAEGRETQSSITQ
jgi:hypothetical protein